MPDAQAGQSVVAQAQELGADVLARLDQLTQQTRAEADASSGAVLDERKRIAQEAIDKMDAIVKGFIARMNAQSSAAQEAQALNDQAEIERIKASISS